jgi:two-component system, chemotaxis family, protein-glutamate methylesterase/glutaminase
MNHANLYVVGLGASAGGLDALKSFFLHLPPSPGMAFVVVTHLLRDHKSVLSKILSEFTNLQVQRMKGIDILQPDVVYVLPENAKVLVKNGTLALTPRGREEVLNNTIDLFFESLAAEFKEHAVAIVFSGMGTDGMEGVKTIHEFGGTVLVQDPESTTFKSMPQAAIKNNHPEGVLPPEELARQLTTIIRDKEIRPGKNGLP